MLNSDFQHRRVVIYARVSTEHEAQISALENQIDWYKPILAARPEWELVGQYIDEEVAFLEALDLDDCVFFGSHISNPVSVLGRLPQDKQALLDELAEGKAEYPQEMLDAHPRKGAEGMIIGW